MLIFNNWQEAAQTFNMDKHRLTCVLSCHNLPSQKVNRGILSNGKACPLVCAGIYEGRAQKKPLGPRVCVGEPPPIF